MTNQKDYIHQLEARIEELEEIVQEVEHVDCIVNVINNSNHDYINYQRIECKIDDNETTDDNHKIEVIVRNRKTISVRQYELLKKSLDYYHINYEETHHDSMEPPF